jgi:hypothetical protein
MLMLQTWLVNALALVAPPEKTACLPCVKTLLYDRIYFRRHHMKYAVRRTSKATDRCHC